MLFFINYEFVICIAFFICIFIMRNIRDEFSINSELRRMTTMLFISDFLYIGSLIFINNSGFVTDGGCQYIELFLCCSLLTITAINPIKKSYQPNNIIPFPLNQDLISNLESAMIMPVSSKMFYDFLNDLGDIKGMTLIALYADLRRYMVLVQDKSPDNEVVEQVSVIFRDYIVPNNTYGMPENEIILELRRGITTTNGKIKFDFDAELFQELYEFCVAGLEVYYEIFKQSDRFEDMKEEVSR